MVDQAMGSVGSTEPTASSLTQKDLVPFVQATREIMRNWTGDQLENRGVIIIVAENGGNVALTSSPGVNVKAVLAAALESHIAPDEAGSINADGSIEVDDAEVERMIVDALERPTDQEN